MRFNLLKSNTILGALVAVLSWLFSPDVLNTIHSEAVAAVLQAVGMLWTAIGVRRAIAKAALGEPK